MSDNDQITLDAFAKKINRKLVTEKTTVANERTGISTEVCRCYFMNVLFTASPWPAEAETIVGAGPNHQRMREDFASKIRGKYAQVSQGSRFKEFPIPRTLTA